MISYIELEIQIEDGRQFRFGREVDGTSRRFYRNECGKCGREGWHLVKKKKRTPYCIGCTRKAGPSPEARKRISQTLRAKYTEPSYKERILATFKPKGGSDHWNWQGGKTSINQRDRGTKEYNRWRREVFKRDLYHCRVCKTNGQLHAHHVIPWAADPSKRFEVSNGITLCESCHENIHSYFREVSHQNK